TATFTATLKTAGRQSLTITDTANGLGAGATRQVLQVVAAQATSLVMSSLPGSVTVGDTRTFVLKALDAYGNVATGYTGTVVTVVSPDPQGWVDPSRVVFTASDAGVHTYTVHFQTVGSQTVSASDFVNQLSVSQAGIQVNAPPATLTWANPASVVY